jgi:alpha-amylase
MRKHSQQRIFAVGEYWSYDVQSLHEFISVTGGDVTLFDAPLLRNFADASKAESSYDLRYIFDGSLVKNEPTLAVTLVANHDTQPLQALENVVEAWFTPLAYAMILLRRDGYPCIFYADYYGAEYTDKGRDGNEYTITIPSHRFLIDRFLSLRRSHAFGDQIDYFDYPNCVGWVRTGDTEHQGVMAVLMSNGDAGLKRMNTFRPNQIFEDATGHITEMIISDGDGWAEFQCPAKSLSVWSSVA